MSTFCLVQCLLLLEDVGVEELLELFVRVVNAKLLEAVLLETFETSTLRCRSASSGVLKAGLIFGSGSDKKV